MILEANNVVHYLLARGLIPPSAVVSGDLRIVPQASRHLSFRVERRRGQGLFLKQGRLADPEAAAYLQREARCYQVAAAEPALWPWHDAMPAFLDFDGRSGVLVIELLVGSSLSTIHARTRSAHPGLAASLGELLGRWHVGLAARPNEKLLAGADAWRAALPGKPPFILSLHRGGIPLPNAAAARVAGFLAQDPFLVASLAGLAREYRAECFCHGDMKFDNCLILDEEAAGPQIRIIDWEIADVGDPCWDIAGVLQSYLLTLLQQTYSLPSMQAACRAFWQNYCAICSLRGTGATRRLHYSLRLAAARLFQSAFEYTLCESTPPWELISQLWQLARGILAATPSSARDLLGIVK